MSWADRNIRNGAHRFAYAVAPLYSAALLLTLLLATTGALAPPASTPAQAPYAGSQGYEIWHTSYVANVVTVVDPADLSVTQTIPLPGGPYTIALGHDPGSDRDIIFVSLWDSGEIVMIDAETKQIDKYLTPPYFFDPQLIASPDGSKIYVNNCAPRVPAVEIDVASQAFFELGVTRTWNMEFSADGITGYFDGRWFCTDDYTGVRIVDLIGGQLVRTAPLDAPRGTSGDGSDLTRIPGTDLFAVAAGSHFIVVDAEMQTIGVTDLETQGRAAEYPVGIWEIQFRGAHQAFIMNDMGFDGEVFRYVDVSDPTMPFYPGLDTYFGEPGYNPNRPPVADGFQIIGDYAYFAVPDNPFCNACSTTPVNLEAWDLNIDPPNKAATLPMPDDGWFTYFAVRKVPVIEQIANIEADAATILGAAGVRESQGNEVIKALEDAAGRAEDGETAKAIRALEKALDKINKPIKAGDLSAAEAQPLIDAINAMIEELSAGG